MRIRSGIAFRLIVAILAACAVIFTGIFSYSYYCSRRLILKKIEENAHNLALRTVNRIEIVLRSVEKIPQNVAYAMEESSYTRDGLLKMLRTVVENNPEIYGSTISFEPYLFDRGLRLFGPYYYKPEGKLSFVYLDETYDYPVWDWYTTPRKTGAPVWTEPYFDKGGGNIIMSTYSVPFYRSIDGEKQFAGVVTADVYLSWLQDIVSSVKIGSTGYAFLISKNSIIVTHPRKELIMKATLRGIAEARNDARLVEVAREMMSGKSGFVPSRSIATGRPCWIAYEPVPSTGWSLGIIFPQGELMADVYTLSRIVVLLGCGGMLVLVTVIVVISRTITRPLRVLAGATDDIARGNLDFTLPPFGAGDEVGALASSFISMRDSLKRYIRELTETTAAKERMESELTIARDIQMSMLPKQSPPFPGRRELDIHAVLEPAREVGGDLYDYFFLDDGRLCFLVGDISGKGVPAALFMAMTITLIKATARQVTHPEEILARVNRQLTYQNDSCMFVTLFCGVLNTATGELSYSNAGHNPPLLVRRVNGIEEVAGASGTVLGIDEKAVYARGETRLAPGDALVMYTDGVTEAFDGEREMFSEERLKAAVKACRGESAGAIAACVLRGVGEFVGGAPQSDDLTIVVIRYAGGKG
ncbi:MAG: SpoIIE family protein phosphatase [Candidatus Aureabacteria bacterium]|nr:SpoIIE family protein phosphatase [Candidatus Auribacterota bacterium]